MMKLHQLDLVIGKRTLLRRLDLQLDAGQCWLIIGRNGAGKSTLLRTMAGLRRPDGGTVSINGRGLPDWPPAELAHRRAYLPQGRSDAFSYNVLDAVLTARHPYHDRSYWESETDQAAARNALQMVDVAHLAERDLRALSGGERQRVAIASALAQDTPLLLLDEPANALDLAHQVSVMELLARLCSEGKTVVLVTHDLNLTHDVATHALLMFDDGHWQTGTAADVMQAPLLGRCLGHAVETVRHGARTIFLPAQRNFDIREQQ
ncbi:MAG TPA: ABC transporter ATP-binding protein [Burkholderiaceae bacterium]|jgi:iron complex transport system ATP-binding protein